MAGLLPVPDGGDEPACCDLAGPGAGDAADGLGLAGRLRDAAAWILWARGPELFHVHGLKGGG